MTMIDPLQASLKIAASGLDAQSTRLRIVSENLANAQSTATVPGGDRAVATAALVAPADLADQRGDLVERLGGHVRLRSW